MIFKSGSAKRQPRRLLNRREHNTSPLALTMVGPIMWRDGLGRIAPCLYESLFRYHSINHICSPMQADFSGLPPSLCHLPTQMIKRQELASRNAASVVISTGILWTGTTNHAHKIHLQESIIQRIKNLNDKKRHISAITMLEGTKIPQEWVSILNRDYDRTYVPCDYLKEVYASCGVTNDIRVLPLPIYGIDSLLKKQLSMPAEIPYPFNFGILSGGWERKNVPMAMKAFLEVFGKTEGVYLKIHSRFGDAHIMEEITAIAKANPAKIQFVSTPVDEATMEKWKNTIHCDILPSGGEGFSMCPREMLARGIPSLISEGHAHQIIIDEEGALPIKISGTKPANYGYFKNLGEEWIPSREHLKEQMLYIYKNYLEVKEHVLKSRVNLEKYSFASWSKIYFPLILGA